jgi:hypothetical protein
MRRFLAAGDAVQHSSVTPERYRDLRPVPHLRPILTVQEAVDHLDGHPRPLGKLGLCQA